MGSFSLQSKARCGESFARIIYERYGYYLLSQNFRCVGSEIDLIFQKRQLIVFVEVKLRKIYRKEEFRVDDLVTERKKQALLRGGQVFLQKNENLCYENIRFDLCVLGYRQTFSFLKIESTKVYQDFLFFS